MRLRIAPIVEGHGEVESIRLLLQRLGAELLDVGIEVHRPIRVSRTRIARPEELDRRIGLASLGLRGFPDAKEMPSFVLLLLDTDPDPRPACELAPELSGRIAESHGHLDVACVLAHPEWETWFVAAASSLGDYLELPNELPDDPEGSRLAKAWIKNRFRGHYSETVDQPKLTARMDLRLCRARSPSFDKLCREIEKRLPDRPHR